MTELCARALAMYESLARGDLDEALGAFHPDVEWHQPGRAPVSGVHRGPKALARFVAPLLERGLRIRPRNAWQIEEEVVLVLSEVSLAGEQADEVDILRFRTQLIVHIQHIGDTAMLERSFD